MPTPSSDPSDAIKPRPADGISPDTAPPPRPTAGRDLDVSLPPPPSRPLWVWLVTLAYCTLLATLGGLAVTVAVISLNEGGTSGTWLLAVPIGVMFLVGFSLLVIPIGHLPSQRSRGPVWIPILGSGLFAGVLFVGAGLALVELFYLHHHDLSGWLVLAGGVAVWVFWAVLFWRLSTTTDPLTLNGWLYKTLIAGGVLELLVAVHSHVIVRQRKECCAGMNTALGIILGTAVMIVAIGPGVFFLFFRRHRQTYARRMRRD
jgi:hypothetical protein